MEQNPYGDKDFSEEHNSRIIEEVDAHNDKLLRQKDREHKQKNKERAEAIAIYLKNLTLGRGITKIDKYFGKKHLAYLRGQEIVNQLKANPETVVKLKERMRGRAI